jgi:iron uptake system component EfeO
MQREIAFFLAPLLPLAALATGCSSSPAASEDYRDTVTTGMHDSLATDIAEFLAASQDLENAAPTPAGRGWDATEDAQAIAAMKDAWIRVRAAYERIEGAIAPLFPEIDYAVDARYDDFLTQLAGAGDQNLFDDQGVTGQHAIERILYSDTIPAHVVQFEAAQPGYVPATFPKTEGEAADFKNKLSAKLVSDIIALQSEWQPSKIDVGGAFQGLISLMNEQREKVNKASTQEEESRYAQRTLADLHDNLEGTVKIYALFQPWLISKSNPDKSMDGPSTDGNIQTGFASLRTTYAAFPGDAIPQPPPTWSSQNPTAADLQSDFGKLFTAIQVAVDPAKEGSIVSEMNRAATILGFPQFVEGQ